MRAVQIRRGIKLHAVDQLLHVGLRAVQIRRGIKQYVESKGRSCV